jgi:hypothetical protein
MSDLYSDPLITITTEGLRIKNASLFATDKTIRWSDIEKVRALLPTVWNGRYKMWGTTTFRTWLAMDWGRPARETIFVLHRKGKWSRIGFTVHDAQRVKQILAERGLLEDEQGAALPSPLPLETRPIWQWGAFGALVLLLLGMIAQVLYYYPLLPPQVATHFNASGNADGFGDKAFLATAMIFAACFTGGLITLISYLIARSKAAITGRYLLWIGAATLAFLVAIANLSFSANLTPSHSMGLTPMYIAAIWFACLAAIIGRMLWRMA